MWWFLLTIVLGAAHAISNYSAASEAQIRFAIENKYDDTGPGAQQPEFAYKTFSNLEDALIGYIDDPDTKLPDAERAKAYTRFVKPLKAETADSFPKLYRVSPKTVEEYTAPTKQRLERPLYVTRYTFPDKKVYYHEPNTKLSIFNHRGLDHYKVPPTFKADQKFKKLKPIKPSSINLGQYTQVTTGQLKAQQPNTEYSYSYGVNDRHTGDQKAAHETRSNGRVSGYYTVMDADGRQRTVRYTADDKEGFKAVVQRTQTNTQ